MITDVTFIINNNSFFCHLYTSSIKSSILSAQVLCLLYPFWNFEKHSDTSAFFID